MDTRNHQKDEQVGSRANEASNITGGKMTKLKVPYFGHIMKSQVSLEKTMMLRKIEGSRTRETPNMSQIDSITESTGSRLQELSRAAQDRTL